MEGDEVEISVLRSLAFDRDCLTFLSRLALSHSTIRTSSSYPNASTTFCATLAAAPRSSIASSEPMRAPWSMTRRAAAAFLEAKEEEEEEEVEEEETKGEEAVLPPLSPSSPAEAPSPSLCRVLLSIPFLSSTSEYTISFTLVPAGLLALT